MKPDEILPVEEEDARTPAEREWPRPWMRDFLRTLATIPDVSSACRFANVGRNTVYVWRDRDPDFAAAWQECLDRAKDNVIRVAYQWITAGMPIRKRTTKTTRRLNDEGVLEVISEETVESESSERSATLMIFWLKAWHPERFRWAERVEASGPDGGPVQVETLESIDAQIEKLAAELRERAGEEPVPSE